MLDPVVFDHVRPYVNVDNLAKWDSEVVPHSAPPYGEILILCQVSIALLGVWLEQDLEVSDDQTSFKGWDVSQIVFTGHMLAHLVLLLSKFNLILL